MEVTQGANLWDEVFGRGFVLAPGPSVFMISCIRRMTALHLTLCADVPWISVEQ